MLPDSAPRQAALSAEYQVHRSHRSQKTRAVTEDVSLPMPSSLEPSYLEEVSETHGMLPSAGTRYKNTSQALLCTVRELSDVR